MTTSFRLHARTLALAGMLALGANALPATARADDATPPTTPTTTDAVVPAQSKTPRECVE